MSEKHLERSEPRAPWEHFGMWPSEASASDLKGGIPELSPENRILPGEGYWGGGAERERPQRYKSVHWLKSRG